uniref:ABC transporter ATP-binding protein n=1 Tax=Agathobacter sp. TaxID=2021311 RepID=UPI004055B75E
MLTLVNISKKYGNQTAVENINLNMEHGLYGMLAPNGAGKTTIIKMITTLLFPTMGEILYDGVNIVEMGAAYRDLIGYLPQQFGYYKNNTPIQYLEYLACLKKMPKEKISGRIQELLELVGLSEVAHKKMKKFSGGMIQRVGIAQAMLNDPKILILDEPTAGLDPKERVRFRNIISMLSKDRIVILSTHIVSDIESIANQVILIKDKHLYKVDTVPNICSSLEGKIYEAEVSDSEYERFEKEHQVLAARQENGKMVVRYYEEKGTETDSEPPICKAQTCAENAVLCNSNLEDVFLVTYQ